jgi:hypothetical protein
MKRLLDGEASDLERMLLESSVTELPGDGARARALSAVLATGAVGATAGTKLLSWSGLKLLSVLALVGLVAGAVAIRRDRGDAQSERIAVTHAPLDLPAQLVTSHTTASAPTASALATSTPPPSTETTATPSIAAELALVDRARERVRSDDAAGALRALDEHDRDFPNGAFALEARVLRVHALVRLGRRAEAEAAARPVLEQAPSSVYAKQVHDLLGS